jgi:hypothetical protein
MVQHGHEMARPAWWGHDVVLLRRKVLAIAPQFQIFDMQGGSLLYCQQKLFKLKEDIRVYSDESKQHEILTIKARAILDFSAAYDVVDAQTQEKVGVLRRKGWTSLVSDAWEILDPHDQPIGRVDEQGGILRRFFPIIPQKYHLTINGAFVGTIKQKFNPFVFKAVMDLSPDAQRVFDRRLAMATGLLLMAIEGRQQ